MCRIYMQNKTNRENNQRDVKMLPYLIGNCVCTEGTMHLKIINAKTMLKTPWKPNENRKSKLRMNRYCSYIHMYIYEWHSPANKGIKKSSYRVQYLATQLELALFLAAIVAFLLSYLSQFPFNLTLPLRFATLHKYQILKRKRSWKMQQ